MSVRDTVACFLDLLLAAEQPQFQWGPPELRTAFQWAVTLQQLVMDARAAAVVKQEVQVRPCQPRSAASSCCISMYYASSMLAPVWDLLLQAMAPLLPSTLQRAVPLMVHSPLQAAAERLLQRPAPGNSPLWLEAVLAAYTAAAVLPSPPTLQRLAEQQLKAAIASLQQSAALHRVWLGTAQQASTAASAQLPACPGGATEPCGLDNMPELRQEAMQYFSGLCCLQAAAAAQLLAQYMDKQLPQPTVQADRLDQQQQQQQAATALLSSLLHVPLSALDAQVLCLLVLLPCWESMLSSLARPKDAPLQDRSASCDAAGDCASPLSDDGESGLGYCAKQAALQLLCDACSPQQAGCAVLLAQHPALPAEVCRRSFRFTCSYALLLEHDLQQGRADLVRQQQAVAQHLQQGGACGAQQQAAAQELQQVTGNSAQQQAATQARWRLAHAVKHQDQVSDYLRTKCCAQGSTWGEPAALSASPNYSYGGSLA